jgi:hypothetical protein
MPHHRTTEGENKRHKYEGVFYKEEKSNEFNVTNNINYSNSFAILIVFTNYPIL